MSYTLCLNCCQLILTNEIERHNIVCRMNHINNHLDGAMRSATEGIESINKLFLRNMKACIPTKGIRLRKRLGEIEEECSVCKLVVKLPAQDDTLALCCDGIHMTQRDLEDRKLLWRDFDGDGVEERSRTLLKRFGF